MRANQATRLAGSPERRRKRKVKKEAPKEIDTKTYFELKRGTEIGNTYYMKAKEFTESEEIRIKKAYMNKQ